jgi:hypothetical protein
MIAKRSSNEKVPPVMIVDLGDDFDSRYDQDDGHELTGVTA